MEPSRPLLNPPFSPLPGAFPGQCQLVYVSFNSNEERKNFPITKAFRKFADDDGPLQFCMQLLRANTSPPGFESFITSCNTGSGHWLPQIHY